ncbi:methyltransferase [Sorangium sp. So ce1128]
MSQNNIQHLVWGLQIAGVIKSAIELRLFDVLVESPGAACDAVARRIGADARGTRILLDAVAAVDLVVEVDGGYRLTPAGERYMVSTSPSYVGDQILLLSTPVMWRGYESLTEAVRAGGTVLDEHAETQSYSLWESFPQHTARLASKGGSALVRLLAERLSRTAALRVLDVACGTGLYGFSVAKEFPRASVTSLDWENVLAHTRKYADSMGVSDRVSYIAGDMFNVDLGGLYDVVITSHVFHHFDDERSSVLMRRLAQVTRPGGLIAIHDFLITGAPPPADPEPYMFATTMLASTRHGDTYTKDRFAALLEASGYGAPVESAMRRMPTRFLFAERVAAPSGGRDAR